MHDVFLSMYVCREVGHHTYVTPTSYLELIHTYKQLLGAQQSAVDQLRKRYEVSRLGTAFSTAAAHARLSACVALQAPTL